MKRSKTFMFARRIKAMSRGESFVVPNVGERTLVVQAAASLKAIGAIDFKVITRENERGGFTVVAI